MIDGSAPPAAPNRNIWRTALWIGLGICFGLVLAAAFIAYGQPELLLKQMNLRYCG